MRSTILSLSQLGLANCSNRESLYKQGIFSNLPLLGAVLFTCGLQVLVIYLALANEVFKPQPLSFHELTIYIGASTVLFHAVELEKWVKSRFLKKEYSSLKKESRSNILRDHSLFFASRELSPHPAFHHLLLRRREALK